MSGLDRLPGSGDAGRMAGRPAQAPAGGAAEPAPAFAQDGFVPSAPRVRVGPPVKAASDGKGLAMAIGGGFLAIGAAVLLGSLFVGTPLLGAATIMAGSALGVPAVALLGLGVSRLLAKREAAKLGER